MRYINVQSAVAAAVVLSGCGGPYYSRETNYRGGATGVVEKRTAVGGPSTSSSDSDRRSEVPVPTGKTVIFVPAPSGPLFSPRYFTYEIRSKDGTVHIAQYDTEFEVGSCIEFSGFADGPSRTHWSRNRISMQRSDKCDK